MIEYLVEENRVLRVQLKGHRLQLKDDQRRRLAAKGHRLGRRLLSRVATIVTPDTILRWHRRLIADKWSYARKRPGRPRTMNKIARLIGRMATENPTWGYSRIQGALKNLDHRVARSTIARLQKEQALTQAARCLTDAVDGFLVGYQALICDRDTKWMEGFRRVFEDAGVRIVQTPIQAPNANAYAERFVRSIREECLDRVILFGERRLRHTIDEYVARYHRERNHQGLGNELRERRPKTVGWWIAI